MAANYSDFAWQILKKILVLFLPHLEPKLKLFEVDDIGDDGDDDLQHHYLPNRLTICFFKSALTNQVPLSDKQACLVQCRYISQSGAFHVAIGKYPVADK